MPGCQGLWCSSVTLWRASLSTRCALLQTCMWMCFHISNRWNRSTVCILLALNHLNFGVVYGVYRLWGGLPTFGSHIADTRAPPWTDTFGTWRSWWRRRMLKSGAKTYITSVPDLIYPMIPQWSNTDVSGSTIAYVGPTWPRLRLF